MATYHELAKDMRQQFKGQSFLNISELCVYLGWGRDKVRSTLNDVDFYETGKEKRFHVLDVAKKLIECQSIHTYG